MTEGDRWVFEVAADRMAFVRVLPGSVRCAGTRDGLGQIASTCSPDLFMMAPRYFDPRDLVNQSATVGHRKQVRPPATPHLKSHRINSGRVHFLVVKKPTNRSWGILVSKKVLFFG